MTERSKRRGNKKISTYMQEQTLMKNNKDKSKQEMKEGRKDLTFRELVKKVKNSFRTKAFPS